MLHFYSLNFSDSKIFIFRTTTGQYYPTPNQAGTQGRQEAERLCNEKKQIRLHEPDATKPKVEINSQN